MPTVLDPNDSDTAEVKVKTAYNGKIMITYVSPAVALDDFSSEMRDICEFDSEQEFTMKWIDEEGDPCIISSQMELDEALRLYEVNKDSELLIHETTPVMKIEKRKVK
ncbi:unnamed protein product [Notodromas monacha]|uniref:PB1 domain-containing protein n=1 Tax=Notodromas monacha TaxID=399045 RepID=A0A7R9GAM4_9CRUS|nr:unnamed protein product [Notodromas monacha]CAG0914180.1 unnamed protein product [Notodromas monacha]